MSNEKENPLSLVLGLYGISVAIFALYFNWQYAQEHGFMSWLFFGEVIATLKAIVWPFIIFSR
jgi:hypothetical protein